MATIEKRGNSYRITVSCGYNVQGKQIRPKITWSPAPGMTPKQIEKELKRQMVLFDEKCRTGNYVDGSMKFAEFVEIFMKYRAEKKLRKTTLAGYKSKLPRIIKAFGHMKLEEIGTNHLWDFYSNLQVDGIRDDIKYTATNLNEALKKKNMKSKELVKLSGVSQETISGIANGKNATKATADKITKALCIPFDKLFKISANSKTKLSDSSIRQYHMILSSILEYAVLEQAILSNPCRRVETPHSNDTEAEYLDEIQAAELFEKSDTEPFQFKLIMLLLLNTGMRRGELCGLEWADIDLKNNLIDINKTSLYLPGIGVFNDTTKTKSSQRIVSIPEDVSAILKQHKAEQAERRLFLGDYWIDSKKVFTKPQH